MPESAHRHPAVFGFGSCRHDAGTEKRGLCRAPPQSSSAPPPHAGNGKSTLVQAFTVSICSPLCISQEPLAWCACMKLYCILLANMSYHLISRQADTILRAFLGFLSPIAQPVAIPIRFGRDTYRQCHVGWVALFGIPCGRIISSVP